MESAQAIYGVTMQEPGVSRLVSVKFDAPAASVVAAPGGVEALDATFDRVVDDVPTVGSSAIRS
jgi:hypothetical protein